MDIEGSICALLMSATWDQSVIDFTHRRSISVVDSEMNCLETFGILLVGVAAGKHRLIVKRGLEPLSQRSLLLKRHLIGHEGHKTPVTISDLKALSRICQLVVVVELEFNLRRHTSNSEA